MRFSSPSLYVLCIQDRQEFWGSDSGAAAYPSLTASYAVLFGSKYLRMYNLASQKTRVLFSPSVFSHTLKLHSSSPGDKPKFTFI
jgi:hypothetical protein